MEKIEEIYQLYKQSYNISTDSRKITEKCVFVALKGEHFDGNDFALQVAEEGVASCVIADRKTLPQHERLFLVADSLSALQQLACHHRQTLKTPIIGITGTNGKTTTKELVSTVLSKKYSIKHTEGNFNNHLGVPLTLLDIKPETEMAVVEMGANHPCEIEQLCNIASPDFGIITNIGKAHLEGFGNFEGVINTKKALYEHLRKKRGTAIVNNDNELLMNLSEGLRRFTYGKKDADATVAMVAAAPYLSVNFNGNRINTKLVGDYNFENVAAAVAAGKFFNVPDTDIVAAIESYTPTNSRSQVIKTINNEIIMDAYNANPTSMAAAVKNFGKIHGESPLLILGDMRELGEESENEHLKIVRLIDELGLKKVFFVGREFMKAGMELPEIPRFNDVDELCEFIKNNPVRGHHIFIKGSRGIKLEKVLEWL